jgi:molecular chaperone HscB
MTPDFFTRLGLPRRFVLDAGEVERQYLARSRAVHPDYHTAGSSADLAASLDVSAALNEAYTTLRDPFTRAEYLLMLEGGPSAGEHKQMAPAFLAEMLEARERLEEVRSASSPCSAGVVELAEEFGTRYDGLLAEAGKGFAELESLPPDDPRRAAVRTGIRANLNAAKYVRGLIRDLNAE